MRGHEETKIEGASFGFAIEAAKAGLRVTRAPWEASGAFVYYVPPARFPALTGNVVPYTAHLVIQRADDSVSIFIPGMDSILADDWLVVEGEQ